MNFIEELKAQRAAFCDQMEALMATAKDEKGKLRNLTDDEVAEWDALKAKVEGIDKQIARAQYLETKNAASAKPVDAPKNSDGGGLEVKVLPAEAKKPLQKGERVGRMVRCIAAARNIPETAAKMALDRWNDDALAKALAAGTGQDGGFLVADEMANEIIDLLRARAVVRASGATAIPMSGTLLMPKLVSGSTAEYVGENNNIGVSQPQFGQLRLTERKLACVVPLSNDLIRLSSPKADSIITNDLVNGIARREDAAFIRDDGTQNAPKGLRYWAPAATHVIPVNGTVNIANITQDLGKAETALLNANVMMINPGWLMTPRVWNYLRNLRTTQEVYAFPEMQEGRLRSFPVRHTTSIPYNLGGGGDESEVYLVDFNDAIIGESTTIELMVSDTAAYHDGTTVQSSFSLDQTVIRAITRHDFGMRHDASVAVLTAVDWGA